MTDATRDADLRTWFEQMMASHADAKGAIHQAYQHLENAGLISRVTVHRYICKSCGPVAVVVRIGDRTLTRTRDYKKSRGKNLADTTPSARANKTLDGERHWPGHTFDVDDLATWRTGEGAALIPVNCRHHSHVLDPADVLDLTRDTTPGHPGAPAVL